MAIYEFECLRCEEIFDVEQPMGTEHIANCPFCKTSKTKRVFTVPYLNIISDKDLAARLKGVPKSRLEKTKELKDDRAKRQKDPKSERDLTSNELHTPKKKIT